MYFFLGFINFGKKLGTQARFLDHAQTSSMWRYCMQKMSRKADQNTLLIKEVFFIKTDGNPN